MLRIYTFATKGRFKRCHLSIIIKSSVILAEHQEIKSSGSGRSLSLTRQDNMTSLTSRLWTAFCDWLKDFCKSWRRASEVWTWDCSIVTWAQRWHSTCKDPHVIWSDLYATRQHCVNLAHALLHTLGAVLPTCLCVWLVCVSSSFSSSSFSACSRLTSPRSSDTCPAQHSARSLHTTEVN